MQYDAVTEQFVSSYQVDLRISNSERAPDFYIPVKEDFVDPEERIQNYVLGSPNSVIYVVGKHLNSKNLYRKLRIKLD